jgi:hypothetical protein
MDFRFWRGEESFVFLGGEVGTDNRLVGVTIVGVTIKGENTSLE